MRILYFGLMALLVAGTPLTSRADDNASPQSLQAANELFSILSPDLMKQITAQMNGLVWPMLEQKAREDKIDDATIAELRHEFESNQMNNLTEIMKQAPPIYARHFTLDEINQLIAFYKSPIGIKAMKELPAVMAEFVGTVSPRLREMQRQSVDGFNDILRQHGYLK
jgi:hypothetical protein